MRPVPRRFFPLAFAVAALLVPFTAASATAEPEAGAALSLSIHRGVRAGGPLVASANLRCFPSGGTQPHPRAACKALEKAKADFSRLPHTSVMCPMIVDRVTVVARGRWRGRFVAFQRTFTNRCMAARDTDDVFEL